ncbi:MAG: hypothetical protein HY854_19160 [Burkholderiales bacterium]|nr:hypothetical protein [Burkholderiales bacterium]
MKSMSLKTGKHLTALAIAALLAACGGGSEPEPMTPQMAVQKLQAKIAVIRAQAPVPIDEQAEQLLDFAESLLPQFFPPTQPTLTFPPFKFRAYSTAFGTIYLGVATSTSGPYVEGHVYVVGAPFGSTLANPLDVGPLTNYITPTSGGGGGGGGGTGNGCFDLALADTQGTVIDVNYQYSGLLSGTSHVVTTVGGMTTFEGQAARSTAVVTTASASLAGVSASGNAYSLREGDNMRHFGSEFASTVSYQGVFTANMTIKSVYSPSYLDTTYTLALGQSVTLNQSGTAYTTISGAPFPIPPTTTPINMSVTHTYVARENVSALGKTLEACKYTTQASGDSNLTTTWYALPKGIPVKIVSTTSQGTQTIEATTATVNGQSL